MRLVLNQRERQDLGRLEAVVEGGKETFVEVGLALMEIRSRRLYRSTHRTWQAYCRGRWGFSRQHGHRLMRAAVVAQVAQTSPTGDIPRNERQAREVDRRHSLLMQLAANGADEEQIRLAQEVLATLTPAEKLARARSAETAALRTVEHLAKRDRLAKIDRLANRLRKEHAELDVAEEADQALDGYLAVIHSAA